MPFPIDVKFNVNVERFVLVDLVDESALVHDCYITIIFHTFK